jgi:hypothetical protein
MEDDPTRPLWRAVYGENLTKRPHGMDHGPVLGSRATAAAVAARWPQCIMGDRLILEAEEGGDHQG